mmetsp:Transcript_19074/g.41119  ORF Transcript_19074/g.41119 Transcript_19074/m.41119 type:complete len:326 (+) Transcript_19074:467-1444(+)
MDLVTAALHMAAEDEAMKSNAHALLPVETFSARLDTMVSEIREQMPFGLSPQEQLDWVHRYLFDTWGLKIAKGMTQGEQFSPYRVYMHHVLTQRCGTSAAAAVILHTLLSRLIKAGIVSFKEYKVGLPISNIARPIAVLTDGSAGPLKCAGMIRWVTPYQLLAEMLGQLKRFFWNWEWSTSSTSGFDSCAQALLNESAAKVSEAIQPNNRPFASMELSMLATERKALITRAIDPQGCYHAAQIRDLGVLLLHAGRFAEGISLLESYQEWLATPSLAAISGEHEHAEETGCCGMTEREEAPGSFAVLVAELLHYERRKGLEAAFSL